MSRKKKGQTVGQRIRAARLAAEMTQEEVAEAAGMKQCRVSAIENGDGCPTVPTLLRLAKAIGCQISQLVDD